MCELLNQPWWRQAAQSVCELLSQPWWRQAAQSMSELLSRPWWRQAARSVCELLKEEAVRPGLLRRGVLKIVGRLLQVRAGPGRDGSGPGRTRPPP